MHRFARMVECCFLCLALPALFSWGAQAQQGTCADAQDKSCVEFGEAFLGEDSNPPLQKSIKGKIASRRNKEKQEKQTGACRLALELPDDDPDKEDRIKKHCEKSPQREHKKAKVEAITDQEGKQRGKRVKTTSVLKYENAGQRYGHTKKKRWDNLVFKSPPMGDVSPQVWKDGNGSNSRSRIRSKTFFADVDAHEEQYQANDDRDCIDRVTGAHLRGVACYEGMTLRATLEPIDGGCEHIETGTRFVGDTGVTDGCTDEYGDIYPDADCFESEGVPKPGMILRYTEDSCYDERDELKTSLIALIDEDGPSSAHDPLTGNYDIDGDGRFGEDPPGEPVNGLPVNEDRDCVDLVTGKHLGGPDVEPGTRTSCFAADGMTLKRTLTVAWQGCTIGELTLEGDPYDRIEDSCYDAAGEPKEGTVPLQAGCKHETFASGAQDGTADACYDAANESRPDTRPVNGGCMIFDRFFDGNPEGTFFVGDSEDGVEDDCFWANGDLKGDASAVEGGCLKLVENECYLVRRNAQQTSFELKTTLAELVDEDDGEPIDDDGDGFEDEDPAATDFDFKVACEAKAEQIAGEVIDTEGMYTPDGGCDLTRAIVVRANKIAMERGGQKAYQADEHGFIDFTVAGYRDSDLAPPKPYGEEERQVVVEETFTAMCDDGMQMDDVTGQCVPDEQVAALEAYRGSQLRAGLAVARSESDPGYAMMGFTFAPPRVRWGLFYKEEIDLWLFSITLFEAKIGYDFSIGVGFRLPVEVSVAGLPGTAMAQQELDLTTSIEPRDFSVDDYEAFCAHYGLGDEAYCQRFAFPDALMPEDGDELGLRFTAFAGLKVVVLEIPLINWGVDVDMDLSEMCSLYLAWQNIDDVAGEMLLKPGTSLGEAVKNLGLNCGSYTTPYGNDERGEPLQFPFIANAPFVNQMIRADCAEAALRGETIKLPNGMVVPLCTGLILGVHGASLGLGVGVDLEVNSNRIEATATLGGDGRFAGHESDPAYMQSVAYHAADHGGSEPATIETIDLDNYDPSESVDRATLVLNDFTYCLNNFSIRLKGQAMFGGILTIFPDFPDFTIYRFTLPFVDETCGIPIGQHAGTGAGVQSPVFVENYCLETVVEADPADPNYVDYRTLRYPYDPDVPGGDFIVTVKNLGSVPGSFDNFQYELSNRPDQATPFTFVINPNNDFDCEDQAGNHFRGNPYDARADDCYDTAGVPLPGRTERIDEDDLGPQGALDDARDEDGDDVADEDPPDDWQTVPAAAIFNGQSIPAVPPHGFPDAGETLTLKVKPYVHPSTRPGLYPFRVSADSAEAKSYLLDAVDPTNARRIGAEAVAYLRVESFFDPRVAVQPPTTASIPGTSLSYTIEGTNMGNNDDSMSVAVEFLDFDQGCSFANSGPDCPFRSVPTVIPADEWTTLASLADRFGPLQPLGSEADQLTVQVPPDWSGMEDTTYEFTVTVESQNDPASIKATNSLTVTRTVLATPESRTRFIGLEIEALIAEIENANAAGVRTGGLLPIAMYPIRQSNERALAQVLAGNPEPALGVHETSRHLAQAFLRALAGYGGNGRLPASYMADWRARAEAIIDDLTWAIASGGGLAP